MICDHELSMMHLCREEKPALLQEQEAPQQVRTNPFQDQAVTLDVVELQFLE